MIFSRLPLFKLFFRVNVAEKQLYLLGLPPRGFAYFYLRIHYFPNRQKILFHIHSCQYHGSSLYNTAI